MNNAVVKLLKEQIWTLGTYSDQPNAVPVAFKDVTAVSYTHLDVYKRQARQSAVRT